MNFKTKMSTKRIWIVFSNLIFLIFLSSCYTPQRSYTKEISIPINTTIPNLVHRGETHNFYVETLPDSLCHAGISFWDINENWIHEELPTLKADEFGVCQWLWKIPENAKEGIAGFRGYIEFEYQEKNIFPATFCVEKCSDE